MVARLDETMSLWDTQSLEDSVGGCHAPEPAERAQPLEVGVLEGDESARSDHSGKHVMVVWEDRNFVDVLVEGGREPYVLLDDLGSLLYDITVVLFKLRETPLCDREYDYVSYRTYTLRRQLVY